MGESIAFQIPESVHRDIAISEHPNFPAQVRRLRFARESYEGSGGYAPYVEDVTVADTQPDDQKVGSYVVNETARTHLFRHPRERKKFQRRVIMAYLTNVIKRALNMLIGYLTKQQPIYDAYPDRVKIWMSRVNVADDNWEQFKEHEILPRVGYYGWLPLIFFFPDVGDVETAAQRTEAGGDLTVEVICPENIIDWIPTKDGSFEWLKIKTEVDRTGPLDGKHRKIDRYTWYTQYGWFAVEDDKHKTILPVVESGTYSHGLPIVVWRLQGGALTTDADATQRELYNINSLVQEQERGTAFAMLKAPDDGVKDRNKEVGSSTVWWFPHDASHTPEWMVPPPDVLQHLMAKRASLAAEILENMGLDFDQGGGQTGMAFQFKMSKIVRLLQGVANSLSRGDTRSMARVALELNAPLDDKVRVVWPTEFDARDVEKELDGLQRILDSTASITAKIEADYRMVLAAIGDMDEMKRKAILEEIEDGREQMEIDEDNQQELELKAEEERQRDVPDPDDEDADDVQADGGAR